MHQTNQVLESLAADPDQWLLLIDQDREVIRDRESQVVLEVDQDQGESKLGVDWE